MKFRRAVQRYGRTPQAVTPYQRAAQVWDERLGSARVQARNWRLMAFGSLFLSTGLSAGLLWQSMQARVVPYVVAVDRLGEARAISPAERDYQPTEPEIAWFLAHFIGSVRSIPVDPVLMRQNWLTAYDFVTGRGSKYLDGYAREANPFGLIGERSVAVQVTSVVRASDTSFQVKWVEAAYERGSLAGTSHWTAMLTVKILTPRSADVLRKNPLGIYVDAIDWSKELEPQAASGASIAPVSQSPAVSSPAVSSGSHAIPGQL